MFDPDLKNKKKIVKGETYYFQQDIKERILKAEPSLSDVIFTNCKNIRCEGLQSVSTLLQSI